MGRFSSSPSVGVLFDLWDAGALCLPSQRSQSSSGSCSSGVYCTIYGFRKDSPIVRPNWRGNTMA